MNFIDKLNVLIGNEKKTTTAAGDPCWNGFGDPTPKFPGTVVSRSQSTTQEGVVNSITYSFPKSDPCITSIIRVVGTRMCSNAPRNPSVAPSGSAPAPTPAPASALPCCLRRNPGLTKCVEVKTMFRIPYEGSGLSPVELDPNHLQIPAGSPIIVVGTISVYPDRYEFTTKGAKPHLADMDALPLDQQTSYINREN